jgi:hypothetical protein
MPHTMLKTSSGQLIGGIFENNKDATAARVDFLKAGVLEANIEQIIQLTEKQKEKAYRESLKTRGVAESQALYYEKALEEGKILLMVHNVDDPATIIDIFDRHGALYNPNGSRNMREDVTGMTAGAMFGAMAGAVVGSVLAGPPGAAGGAATGAVVGGGVGAAMGKNAEHRK